jgi:hypothetical protein
MSGVVQDGRGVRADKAAATGESCVLDLSGQREKHKAGDVV